MTGCDNGGVNSEEPARREDEIRGGLAREDAIASFIATCNQPGTMFITDRWVAPRMEKLRSLLPATITDEQASVLRELAKEETGFDSVFAWLESPDSPTWEAYCDNLVRQREEQKARRMEEGIFPWPDVEESRRVRDMKVSVMPHGADPSSPRSGC